MTDEPTILDAIHLLPRPFELDDAERLIVGDGDGRYRFWSICQEGDPTLIRAVGAHLRYAGEIEVDCWILQPDKAEALPSRP